MSLSDPWVSPFFAAFSAEVTIARACLSEANLELFLSAMLNFAVRRIEQAIMRKRFSLWGGLQIDKEIRALLSLCSQHLDSTIGIRDKFARLIQTASVLQVERVAELSHGLSNGAGGFGRDWRLTEADVRAALALRSDLPPAEVAQFRVTRR
jgi:hypothetical protein